VLLITGTLGAGKSVIADEIHEQLCVADIPHAMIDLDNLGSAWPRKLDMSLRNLNAVWDNYRADGIDRLILVSMLRSREHLDGIRQAVPELVLTVCLVRAPNSTIDSRLRARHVGSDIDGHLRDSSRYASMLDSAGFEDFRVNNEGRTVPEIAADILMQVGWIHSPHLAEG
jgi:gluconate kinase